MRLGILYAMPKEADSLLASCGAPAPVITAGVSFYKISDKTVVCVGGVGKVNAAMATQLLIDRYGVDRILNVGCAGALGDFPTGTLVLGTDCVQHDVDTTLAGDPPGLVSTVNCVRFSCAKQEETLAVLNKLGETVVPGVIATGDWFGRDYDRAAGIRDTFDAVVCEMEACAASQVAMRNHIPFLTLKTVTDHLFATRQDREYQENFNGAMEHLNDVVRRYIKWMEEEKMERIASFTVDHTVLVPGMYLSRQDGDIVTYDLRFKKPNTGDLLSNEELHSTEHLIATLLRNSEQKEAVIYFGPMGCQTGFYLLVDGTKISHADTISLLQKVCAEGAAYEGEMPGKSAVECGNYRNLDIDLAKKLCAEYGQLIADWTEDKLAY